MSWLKEVIGTEKDRHRHVPFTGVAGRSRVRYQERHELGN